MPSVEDIKHDIESLSIEERTELVAWLHEWHDDDWDEQMKRDAAAGKFDKMLEELDADRRAGRLREWP